MRALRFIISLVFVAALGLYGYFYYTKNEDTSIPKMHCDVAQIELLVGAENDELLKHITAYDEKDGELTSKVIVEKVSAFIEFGKVNVTFAVCDSDNNVSKITVPVLYTDYEAPHFDLASDLVFKTGSPVNIKDCITASDKIDGDLTQRLIVVDNQTDVQKNGAYPLTLKVTNSKSFTYTMDIDLIMTDSLEQGYKIELSKYFIYKQLGESVDYKAYIKSASVPYGKNESYEIEIDSSQLDNSKAGVYNVFYYEKVGGETKSVSRLIVCYEEKR